MVGSGGGNGGPRSRGPVSTAVVAVSGPSLDLGENDSTRPEEAVSDANGDEGRGPNRDGGAEAERYDCRDTFRNFEFENQDGETAPYRCGSWDCYCCGYRMRMNLIEEIKRVTSERPGMCRLLTLTLDPEKCPVRQDEQHKYITERWNALRTRLKREIGDFSYIWVREEQENGLPHLHAIVSRFLPQKVVSAAWSDLGGGEVVDIRKIDRTDKAAHYVGKYLTKNALSGLPDGIQRYNSSSDITLDVRGDKGESKDDWELLMDDFEITNPEGEPLRRGVTNVDFVQQREWGGPIPPD